MIKPENVQLIHPPIMIIGRTLVKVPFIISIAMPGSKRMEREGGGERRQRERWMDGERKSQSCGTTNSNFWLRQGREFEGGEH